MVWGVGIVKRRNWCFVVIGIGLNVIVQGARLFTESPVLRLSDVNW